MSITTPSATTSPAAVPYPAGSGAQACADWCASQLAQNAKSMAAAASSAAAILAWTSQRQWLADGGALASYPLPVASGPVMALPVYGGSQVTGSLAADASLIMKSQ